MTPEGSRWTDEIHRFAKEVKTVTEGRVAITIYTAGVMGDEDAMVRKLVTKELDVATLSDVALAVVVKEMHVLNLPFFIKSDKEAHAVMDKLSGEFGTLFERQGYKLMTWTTLGPGYLFTDRPVKRPSDLTGLSVWQWEGDLVGKALFEEFPGVTPKTVPILEVKEALQKKELHAVYNVPLGAVVMQWYPHLKYAIDTPLVMAGGGTIMRLETWESIGEKDRKKIDEISRKYEKSLRERVSEDSAAAVRGLKKSGVNFVPIAPEGMEELVRTSAIVKRKLVGVAYPQELLDKIEKVLADYRRSLENPSLTPNPAARGGTTQ